jgi:hypothetical protein
MLSPKPIRSECFFPSDFLKSKYEASSFDPFAPTHKSTISNGERTTALSDTCEPMLKKKIGDRKT